jgi:protein-disulfide isomerase
MMKKLTVTAVFVGIAVVGGAAWAAETGGWLDGWINSAKAAVGTPAAAPAKPAAAQPVANAGNALDIMPGDRVMGSMMAPVTMIEYASMTCSHCAEFSLKTMPQVKKDWIATGKVKYVLRDLAWDDMAVGITKVARCVPAQQYYGIVDAFFKNQTNIVTSNDPLGQIKTVAAGFGLDGAKVEACVKDADLHARVEASKKIATETLGIRGTPTSYINGVKVDGAVPYEELKPVLEAAYAKAKTGN